MELPPPESLALRRASIPLDRCPIVWHSTACVTMAYGMMPPLMIDLSGERCARSVRGLSAMTRSELEAFLQSTARASGSVVPARAPRPKQEKLRRTWRPSWR